MRINVRMFAVARELTNKERAEVEVPAGATVAELRAALASQHPPLAAVMSSLLIAVNAEYVPDDAAIPQGAEVACIPPVSGG